jgi:hypothetical protein
MDVPREGTAWVDWEVTMGTLASSVGRERELIRKASSATRS